MLIKNIKNYIENKDLTIREFAQRCDIKENTLYSILSGQTRSPTIDVAQKIANEMGVSIDTLIGNTPKPDAELEKIQKKVQTLNKQHQTIIYAMIHAAIDASKNYNQ